MDRRKFLKGVGATGVAAVAGCLEGDDSDSNAPDSDEINYETVSPGRLRTTDREEGFLHLEDVELNYTGRDILRWDESDIDALMYNIKDEDGKLIMQGYIEPKRFEEGEDGVYEDPVDIEGELRKYSPSSYRQDSIFDIHNVEE